MRPKSILIILTATLLAATAVTGVEINTTLMHSTYRIEGPTGEPNKVTFGTVFIMGIPDPNKPGIGWSVLVTAAHVLDKIAGEKATIYLRRKTTKRHFKKERYELQIRNGTKRLWVRHPTADIAVMKVTLPDFALKQTEEIPALSTELFANDSIFEKYEIHPGDELLCLGYPLGAEANPSGFPILRAGRIASYPLTPAKDVKYILFTFEVFEGNSGGPVYFVDKSRFYGGSLHLNKRLEYVIGVVSKETYSLPPGVKQTEINRDRARYEHRRLKLAIVVPAHFIKETLELLDKK